MAKESDDIVLPVTLRPSRWKLVMYLLFCVAMTIAGIFVVRDGSAFGYFFIGVCGLAGILFLVNLHPRAAYLRLEKDGFTFCNVFRVHTVQWADVQRFEVLILPRFRRWPVTKYVAWNFQSSYPRKSQAYKFARQLSGFEAQLPDTYGMSAAHLVELLESCRRRWQSVAGTALN